VSVEGVVWGGWGFFKAMPDKSFALRRKNQKLCGLRALCGVILHDRQSRGDLEKAM
jgi:hypothetical protein